MKWLKRLFGSPAPPPMDSLQLRDHLFGLRQNPQQLIDACVASSFAIYEHFDSWRTVPVEIRDNPEQTQVYFHSLIAVAQTFAEYLGDPSLMHLLMGPPGTNPIEQWQQRLEEARALKEQLRYTEAAEELTNLLIDIRKLQGTAVETYLPVTLGELGECYFQAGEAARAVGPTQQALEMVRRAGDKEGELAYLGNLYEMHRYLGECDQAAQFADQLASFHALQGNTTEATRYRGQSRRVRAGEPLNRVVVEIAGQRYEVEEVLEGIEGSIRFYFQRNRITLHPSEVLVTQGEKLASQGKYEDALALFQEARQADRFNPQPSYEAAVTLMHLERIAEAIEQYALTEELAPGWFHCRSEMWLAQQILTGRIDPRMFLLIRAVEDGGMTPEAQRKLIEQGLAQSPDLAILHYLHGKTLRAMPDQAIAAFRRGLLCAEEPDIHTRLLVELAGMLDPCDERRELVGRAIEMNGNLIAVATARMLQHFDHEGGLA